MAESEFGPRRTTGSAPGWGSLALTGLLLASGLLFAVLYHLSNNAEHHSFNAGAAAPYAVHVTLGRQYELSTPGGVKWLAAQGVTAAQVSCTYYRRGGGGGALALTALGSDTRTVHAVATFIGPVTDSIHLQCTEVAGSYVDDADNGASDPAGLFILLATVSLSAGALLAMSVLYRRTAVSAGEGFGGDDGHIATDI